MIPVILESPYSGSVIRNSEYLQRAIYDSISRGEAPFASHQMYTGALDDSDFDQRLRGIEAGYVWWQFAKAIVFYTDYGWSPGMLQAHNRARQQASGCIILRSIGENP